MRFTWLLVLVLVGCSPSSSKPDAKSDSDIGADEDIVGGDHGPGDGGDVAAGDVDGADSDTCHESCDTSAGSVCCEAADRCCKAGDLGLTHDVCAPRAAACPIACPGGASACPVGQFCAAGGCADSCPELSRCGFNGCCAAGAACIDGQCQSADLVPQLDVDLDPPDFELRQVSDSDCAYLAGCATGTGQRKLMHLHPRIANQGTSDLRLGFPADSAQYTVDACDPLQYQLDELLAWRVIDGEDALATGTLAGRCLADSEPPAGPHAPARYSCGFQGLSPDWTVLPLVGAACDFVDVTDLDPGSYDLELTVNPSQALPEASYANDTLTVPVDIPDLTCLGFACGDDCCPSAELCVNEQCMLPDLFVVESLLGSSLLIDTDTFAADSCEMNESCIDAPGRRRLLRFSTETPNVGNADLVLGDPSGNPNMQYDDCHHHYHFQGYASYRLKDGEGNIVANGHKQSFCLEDLASYSPDAPPIGQFTCGNQGISLGWADIYSAGIDCNWIDITEVPAGDYTLEVEVNPDHILTELDYDNNTAAVPVNIPDDPSFCHPVDEICGDGLDQNCDGVPDDGCPPITDNDTCGTAHPIGAGDVFLATIGGGTAADVTPSCGGAGGDVFFSLTLGAPERIYLSTYGSTLDTVLAVYDGACTADSACTDDACATTQSDWTGELAAGTYVIAVKAKTAAATGTVQLNVARAGCTGAQALVEGANAGNTTGGVDSTTVSCDSSFSGAPDDIYFFTTCPGTSPVTLSTCDANTGFDTLVEVRAGACNGLPPSASACEDQDFDCADGAGENASTVSTSLDGAGLWFVVVDGWNGAHGTYQLNAAF